MPLIRVDTTIRITNVRYTKVFALAFTNQLGEDLNTIVREFVVPKLTNESLFGSAIVQLDSVDSGENHHSGRGDEKFAGILTQVFVSGTDDTLVTSESFGDNLHVYIMTMDGINETKISAHKIVNT